jgi:MscS family membrane protein
MSTRAFGFPTLCLLFVFAGGALLQPQLGALQAQTGGASPAAQPAQPEPPKDPLGRDTPRGTVLGFMAAGRSGNAEVAVRYLNTRLQGERAATLARQLFVVLDRRLPTRINLLSDRPEGALSNPLKPDHDVVGTLTANSGPVELVVERIRAGDDFVWLFSRETLDAIPEVYGEIDLVAVDRYLPTALTNPRLGGIRLFQWVVFILIIPLTYRLLGLVDDLLSAIVAAWHFGRSAVRIKPLPGSVRLFVIALGIRWAYRSLELPLVERQFWSAVAAMLGVAAVVWMLIQLNAFGEHYFRRQLRGSSVREAAALLRLAHRAADVLVVLIGLLVVLRYFGIDATAALAGLGIGGLAVALAAQKTLENVIGGLSIVFDGAVQVGDSLKLGNTVGTVDEIGLRSTRIRTLDRTIVSIPNGQIATETLETLSERDKFWFRHVVGLRYETTPGQLRTIIEAVRTMIAGQPRVEADSVRVRLLRLGTFSLDIEVFAYFFASDWNAFLEIQEGLLLRIMEIVEEAGSSIAFPTQTLHVADGAGALPAALPGARPAARASAT